MGDARISLPAARRSGAVLERLAVALGLHDFAAGLEKQHYVDFGPLAPAWRRPFCVTARLRFWCDNQVIQPPTTTLKTMLCSWLSTLICCDEQQVPQTVPRSRRLPIECLETPSRYIWTSKTRGYKMRYDSVIYKWTSFRQRVPPSPPSNSNN